MHRPSRRSLRTIAVSLAAIAGLAGLRLAGAFVQDATPSQMMKGPPAPKDWPAAATQPASTQPVDVPEAHVHTPQQTIAMTKVPPGYHLELVAAEPDVISPVCLAWDGDGRMYVAEMQTYMLDVDASREKDPISRVIRLEDTKGDGSYAKRTTFVDKMVLPRMILPLDQRVLIRQTDSKDIYAYRDTKGTGTADEKVKVYDGGPGRVNDNLEHQASGLLWDLDNWIYVTHDGVRFRWQDNKLEADKKFTNKIGQWGIAMDDAGRLIYATGGNELPAHDFQVMPQYWHVNFKDELVPHFTEVFPILPLADIQGGYRRMKSGGGLSHFTGCGGPSIFRGDALPKDLYGDYILPEPVGRIIRRAKVTNVDGKTVLSNAYDQQEFIASMDANFRPVWTATGPDGCLYICDLSHGIIQEHEWTKQGTYLRPQIKKYGLDKNNHAGRIYRLVYDGIQPRHDKPHMLEETPAQLVAHLSDPNGWWRDTAQKLLIVRGDKSVLPALTALARSDGNPITRLHALWTIDGLDATNPELIVEKFQDADWRVRAAAIRIAEPLIGKDDPQVMAAVTKLATDADPNVASQYCISVIYAKNPKADQLVKDAMAARDAAKLKNEVPKDEVKQTYTAIAKAKEERENQRKLAKRDPRLAKLVEAGRNNYMGTCIACHGQDGQGQPAPEGNGMLAPPLAGSRRLVEGKEVVGRILLHGLTGPHDFGRTYPNEMASFAFADDEWIASTITFARQSWGNRAGAIWPEEVAKVRKETEARDKPYTLKEIDDFRPKANGAEASAEK